MPFWLVFVWHLATTITLIPMNIPILTTMKAKNVPHTNTTIRTRDTIIRPPLTSMAMVR